MSITPEVTTPAASTWEEGAKAALEKCYVDGSRMQPSQRLSDNDDLAYAVENFLRMQLPDPMVDPAGWAGLAHLQHAAAICEEIISCEYHQEHLASVPRLVPFLAAKQAAYGSGNILRFGLRGIQVRVSDKIERIKNMLGRDRGDDTEPLIDAYIDIIGYAVIAQMIVDGTFLLPLERDTFLADPQPDGPVHIDEQTDYTELTLRPPLSRDA